MTTLTLSRAVPRCAQRGISLIETMVGMTVGLIASFVVLQSFSSSEGFRRAVEGSSDATQTAAIIGSHVDMLIQEAGAALTQGQHVWGCLLKMSRAGTQYLPRSSAYPAPFSGVPQQLRVVPIAIADGGSGSDALVIMAGNSAASNRDILLDIAGVSVSSLTVSNTNGIGLKTGSLVPSDLLLVAQRDVASPQDCQIVQVASTFTSGTPVLDPNLGTKVMPTEAASSGANYNSIPLNVSASSYGPLTVTNKSPAAFHLGRESSALFSILSINSNRELVEFDILERVGVQSIGDNVFLLKARYGLDNGANGGTPNDNVIDAWVSPSETGWTIASLMNGQYSTEQKINQIKAIRVALVLRSTQTVRAEAQFSSLTLFADLGSTRQYVRDLSSAEKAYQYQIFDWVIPLRNMKAIPGR